MKKKSSHFSVEDIIRNKFRKPVSRGTIGMDANGLLWAYGIVLKDSRYCVEVITIDLETDPQICTSCTVPPGKSGRYS